MKLIPTKTSPDYAAVAKQVRDWGPQKFHVKPDANFESMRVSLHRLGMRVTPVKGGKNQLVGVYVEVK